MVPTDSVQQNSKNFFQEVARTIRRHGMFTPGDKVLIGVSGGPDSMALLHALIHLSPCFSIQLGVAHLNHGLRQGAADQDEAFVADRASLLTLPFFVRKTDVKALHKNRGGSLEEAARAARYDFFQTIIQQNGFTKLALGHHQDDNAELILMNLIRGSGILGLSGIPAVRGQQIVRPLMDMTKKQIHAFLKEQGIDFVTDGSNLDMRFLRNRIRHELLPLLISAYNPRMVETLNRLGHILRDEEAWAEEKISAFMAARLTQNQDGELTLSTADLQELPVAAKKRVVRAIFMQLTGSLRRLSANHIDAVLSLGSQHKKGGAANLPDGVLVERLENRLCFQKTIEKRPKPTSRLQVQDPAIAPRVLLPSGFHPFNQKIGNLGLEIRFSLTTLEDFRTMEPADGRTAFFDLDQLDFPMILRKPRAGDRFQPLGLNGHQQLKKFFINLKIPRTERTSCLVLECNGKIIWLLGYRIDESVKVTHNTSQIVKAEILLAG